MTTTANKRRLRVEQGAKRVRAVLGGETVADTIHPVLVWEVPYYPAYYFPIDDVRIDLLEPDGDSKRSPSRGDGTLYTVSGGNRVARGAALRYADSPMPELRDLIRLDWHAMDAWYEEDEEVFTHPRDPYTRVDVLSSSRDVRVEVDGVEVAVLASRRRSCSRPACPPRFYLPPSDVRMDLLQATDTVSHCPYKGQAAYWSVGDRRDLAWSYREPFHETEKIAGLIAFYNEKVDIHLDGVLQDRPRTKFS